MASKYIYYNLCVPKTFDANDYSAMLDYASEIDNDMLCIMHDNFDRWVTSLDNYELSESEFVEMNLFELDEGGVEQYKKSLIMRKFIKASIKNILSPIAFKTYQYNSYRKSSISDEGSFYIVSSGGDTYGEDPTMECAEIRAIKSLSFKELKLKR